MKILLATLCLLTPVVLKAQEEQYSYTVREITLPELYTREYETRGEELELKANRDVQETAVHRQTRTVAQSASGVARSRSSVEGKLLGSPGHNATLDERIAASTIRERPYPEMDSDVAVMEAVYRRMLGYREMGFATGVKTFFLGSGELGDDPPSVVVDRLQTASDLGKAGLTMLPFSRALPVSRDGILDRRTLERGVVFRVNSTNRMADGTVTAVGSFSERDGFYFTKEFRLREREDGNYEILSERDYAVE
jgi:hypothetical protein